MKSFEENGDRVEVRMDIVNGSPIIARIPVGSIDDYPRTEVIVCDRGRETQRFVVWRVWWYDGRQGEIPGPEASWGYYTDDLHEAIRDMCDRSGYVTMHQEHRIS